MSLPELIHPSPRLAIVGSREYEHCWKVEQYVNSLDLNTMVISGDAEGPDKTAITAARRRGMRTLVYAPLPAETTAKRIKAKLDRNTRIVQQAERVIAYWDGKSRGTLDTIKKAIAKGIPVEINP